PLSIGQWEVQARGFEGPSATPMIGGWWRALVRPDRTQEPSGSPPDVQVEKQPVSLPDAKAPFSESENPVQESERPAQPVPSATGPVPNAAEPAPNVAEPAAPAARPHAEPRPVAGARPLEEINEYLWSVYQRSGTKRDSTGDFTWKDEAAAA